MTRPILACLFALLLAFQGAGAYTAGVAPAPTITPGPGETFNGTPVEDDSITLRHSGNATGAEEPDGIPPGTVTATPTEAVTPTPTEVTNTTPTEVTNATPAEAANATPAGNETSHRLTFVVNETGMPEGLEAAAAASSLNVTLLNETGALSYDFSNETLVFLASLDNVTVEAVNATLSANAVVITFDLGDGPGTPADGNMTRYWLYGGEENLGNLILALDEIGYGTAHDLAAPVPPAGRPEFSYVADIYEAGILETVADDPFISAKLNVTVYHASWYKTSPFDLSRSKVILLSEMTPADFDTFKDAVMQARDRGAVIIAWGPKGQNSFHYPLNTINTTGPEFATIQEYMKYPSQKNYNNLVRFIGVTYCNLSMSVEPPEERPLYGIYHPDAPEIFADAASYLDWYAATGTYDAAAPTVGIMPNSYKYLENDKVMIDALVRSFEGWGANVIVGTYGYDDPVRTGYFLKDGNVLIDTAVRFSTGARLDSRDPDRGIRNLQELNVPVLYAIRPFYENETTWKNSPHGVSPGQRYDLSYGEQDGLIEPIVIAAKELDPVTGTLYNKPIDDQVAWMTDRTLGWVRLHRTANAEKKVVIPYYADAGGKAGVGSDPDFYLDAQASLSALLGAMKERGYNLGSEPLPDRDELAELMMTRGHNIATWAPEILEERVQQGDCILIPESQYLQWFNELPKEKQDEMTAIWGPPPGNIMVYEGSIVIPTIRYGNVLLVPHPVWGWDQDDNVLYHDGEIPPTHQYLAFYMYMDRVYDADAIFSIFSNIPMMPGKEGGLAADDWGAILSGDMPHISVLSMDAEGTFNRRRANMAIVDFMTPVLIPSGLYGPFADLEGTLANYREVVDDAVKARYKEKILAAIQENNIDRALGADLTVLKTDNSTFEAFLPDLSGYLREMKTAFMPYGSHTLSETPTGESLVAMIEAMLGPEYAEHVSAVDATEGVSITLLSAVILNGTSPAGAQSTVLGTTSAAVTADLELALDYLDRINGCSIEIPRILDALEAKYIPPGPNGDPVRNPDALPTGRNLHTFDDRIIPTRASWAVGKDMGDALLQAHCEKHDEYPDKVAFLLWSCETSRHQGTMESEIFWMLGVRPVWGKGNRVNDVELIPAAELGRPRIDVLVVTSGLYRDIYGSKLKLIDKAVRLAAAADDGATPNYVKVHSEAIYQSLIAAGYGEEEARQLSLARIFCPPPDSYNTNTDHAIGASDTWEDRQKIADLYISRMSYIYGLDTWGEQYIDVFKENLGDVDCGIFSRSTTLYGTLDHPHVAAYVGGLSLAIESVTGSAPDMYINNLRSPGGEKVETLENFLSRDLYSRYLNPEWIRGMMEHGYDGARYMNGFVEYLWIWDVSMPDLITGDMWDSVYETYVGDCHDLGVSGYLDSNNPYAFQSMAARMLDAIRTGYWTPSEAVKQRLAQDYQKSVDAHGVTCCHHTCGNLILGEYIAGVAQAAQQQQSSDGGSSEDSGGRDDTLGLQKKGEEANKTNGDTTTNTTAASGGFGMDSLSPAGQVAQKADPGNDVSGKVMKETTKESATSSTTGMPLLAFVLVLMILGAVGTGFWYRRR
ncbi:MAG: cobaltochelatase subunit CobN [Methanoculleus sp.]|nr:cobaltochelatase subunit CobN [Methanoculleus sp.]